MMALASVVTDVLDDGLVGGPLLDRVFAGTTNGSPAIRTCFQRLLHRCHQVFYNQLMSWVVYGRLPCSGCEEFFVTSSPVDGFVLNESMLPNSHLPLRVAEAALFVGKAVQLISSGKRPDTASDGDTREVSTYDESCDDTSDKAAMLHQLTKLKEQQLYHALTVGTLVPVS
jgi:hypothetical protein